jgi:membrane protease YdiL (CAAX protease family)
VLFFPGFYSSSPGLTATVIPFSAIREFSRFFAYSIPGLALIWYLILEKKSLLLGPGAIKPGKREAISFLLGLPGLIIISASISSIAVRFFPFNAPVVEAPSSALGWIAVGLSCLGTGYLEESYFRFYLLQKLESLVPNRFLRVLFSTLLFALCHSYEGLWGMVNAALAGFLLSFLFEKYRSLHGIACAHVLYNSCVYIFSSLSS